MTGIRVWRNSTWGSDAFSTMGGLESGLWFPNSEGVPIVKLDWADDTPALFLLPEQANGHARPIRTHGRWFPDEVQIKGVLS